LCTSIKRHLDQLESIGKMNFKNFVKLSVTAVIEKVCDFRSRIKLLIKGVFIDYAPGAYAIGWDDVLVLSNELDRYVQHEKITYLEIGSGFSTVAIAKLAANKFKKIQIFSLEQDSKWIEKTKLDLHKNLINFKNLEQNIEILKIDYDLRSLKETVKNLKSNAPFDIIFVDAPPDIVMPNSRKKVIDIFIELLSSKGTLIIHDTNRNDEMYAYESIRRKFLSSVRFETKKGISILRFPINGDNSL
jgi:protein-L-isoaspartate O-methyltransferase